MRGTVFFAGESKQSEVFSQCVRACVRVSLCLCLSCEQAGVYGEDAAMFLQWVAKCELVPLSADSYVLKVRNAIMHLLIVCLRQTP